MWRTKNFGFAFVCPSNCQLPVVSKLTWWIDPTPFSGAHHCIQQTFSEGIISCKRKGNKQLNVNQLAERQKRRHQNIEEWGRMKGAYDDCLSSHPPKAWIASVKYMPMNLWKTGVIAGSTGESPIWSFSYTQTPLGSKLVGSSTHITKTKSTLKDFRVMKTGKVAKVSCPF